MTDLKEIEEKLTDIFLIVSEIPILQKSVLSFEEACIYLNLSDSHLYKLTSARKIPCYRPEGKKLYFKKNEMDDWMLRNRQSTTDEIEMKASNYVTFRGKMK